MPCPTQHIQYYSSFYTFSEHQAHMTEPNCTTRHLHPDVPHAHEHHLPHQALLLVHLGAGMVEQQQAHVTRHLLIARTGMLQCDTATLTYYLLLMTPTTTHIMPTLSIYALK